MLDSGVTGITYETLQLDDGSAAAARADERGRGTPVGSGRRVVPAAPERRPRRAAVGRVGRAAWQSRDPRRRHRGHERVSGRVGIGADVSIPDVNPTRLRYVHDILGGHVTTVMSNRANIEEEALDADLVIGSVLIRRARAPKLLSRQVIAGCAPAALVDISIDQGGNCGDVASHDARRPDLRRVGVVHYCVTNMPGMVPHTSTHRAHQRHARLRAAAADPVPTARSRRVLRGGRSTCATEGSCTRRSREAFLRSRRASADFEVTATRRRGACDPFASPFPAAMLSAAALRAVRTMSVRAGEEHAHAPEEALDRWRRRGGARPVR